ncbi:hypothetical protein BO70DRAFT_32080 [Aspergillus heteromorphus CBS 117.55]|uniref:Uncharacterized protein n=1 Tax=Aspergillus heteromorphus CBS 117.55 TaxID=1448321 RepID=A0A317WAW3_9EURO|nr:uncharacterized protein BO70DRAFT_32080 [Aspergillus heteromorphus CBS 117.55]PWY82931.1 hypothetical protein BO70DRAFT_32080 [Aspergillus heteromorphus CBS 117.55]
MPSRQPHYHPYHTTTTTTPLPHQKPPSRSSKPTTKSNSNSNSRGGRGEGRKAKAKERCFTWLLLPSSKTNTHIAKNRSSFSTYRRAPCKIANQRVLGVGTVQLRVQRAPDDPRTNVLVLRDVLHVPGARWNGVAVDKAVGDCSGSEGEGEGEGAEWDVRSRSSVGSSSGSERAVGVRERECFQVRWEVSRDQDRDRDQDHHGHGHGQLGEGLWFARERDGHGHGYENENEHGLGLGQDGLRVVLAGEHDDGELEGDDGRGMMGVVASKEELDMLSERVRNRSWV